MSHIELDGHSWDRPVDRRSTAHRDQGPDENRVEGCCTVGHVTLPPTRAADPCDGSYVSAVGAHPSRSPLAGLTSRRYSQGRLRHANAHTDHKRCARSPGPETRTAPPLPPARPHPAAWHTGDVTSRCPGRPGASAAREPLGGFPVTGGDRPTGRHGQDDSPRGLRRNESRRQAEGQPGATGAHLSREHRSVGRLASPDAPLGSPHRQSPARPKGHRRTAHPPRYQKRAATRHARPPQLVAPTRPGHSRSVPVVVGSWAEDGTCRSGPGSADSSPGRSGRAAPAASAAVPLRFVHVRLDSRRVSARYG
ncbi:hypothetical protein SAMN04489747_3219 [Auraticoccus monumenti]|uniref:Uncharacterized protein n=1 Tax=Auraticoccus monumenti TaxID=675864 RepID=A0A1G7CB21_9ACTN|nr:hypothetical protein SAMN04489747_3219 [Auraticoccus monumenti]